MSPSSLAKVISMAIRNRRPLLIKGAPGIGKSDIVAQACNEAWAKLIIEHPVVSDPTDFKGLPFPSADGQSAHFLPFGSLLEILKYDDETKEKEREVIVYFIDDLGQAPPAVQAAAMQLILARRINGLFLIHFLLLIILLLILLVFFLILLVLFVFVLLILVLLIFVLLLLLLLLLQSGLRIGEIVTCVVVFWI